MTTHTILISSGTGPVEVRSFVARLAARVIEQARARGLEIRGVVVHGPEQAPRSVAVDVMGDAPAALADEWGTHALIARSSRRGKRSRKRWYAAVTLGARLATGYEGGREVTRKVTRKVTPKVTVARGEADDATVSIDTRDIEVQACRAGGPGGQHVNKTNSAVRVLHRPTGISVRVSAERSQHANRRLAIARIEAEIAAQRARAKDSARASERAQHHRLERGAPVRTYRLDDSGQLRESDRS